MCFLGSKSTLEGSPQVEALAHEGNLEAQLAMASSLFSNEKKKQANSLYWMKKAAEQGNAIANKYVAIAYWKGLGTPANSTKSEKWFYKAIASGDPSSMAILVQMLEEKVELHRAAAVCQIANDLQPDLIEIEFKRLRKKYPNLSSNQVENEMEKIKALLSISPLFEEDKLKAEAEPINDHFSKDSQNSEQKLHRLKMLKFGKKTDKQRRIYIGDLREGMENGYGTSYTKDGMITYQGLWVDGKPKK